MKFMLWLMALCGYSISVHGSALKVIAANPGGIGGIFKGPDSETIVHGPDGSIITSEQQGGAVQTEAKLSPIVVAEPQVIEVAQKPLEVIASPAQPIPLVAAPVEPVGHTVDIIEPDPHIIETEIVDAPDVEPKESTELIGPSGSISTRGSESVVSGPASTTISKPAKILFAAPVIPAIPALTINHAPPVTEVRNELPLVPLSPVSTVLSQNELVSTVAPPLYVGSTITSPGLNQFIPLVQSNNPTGISLDGISRGSTLIPPIYREPLHTAVNTDEGRILIDNNEEIRRRLVHPYSPDQIPRVSSERPVLLTGEQYDDVRGNSNLSPPLLNQQTYVNGFSSTESPIVSSTLQPTNEITNRELLSSGVNVLDEGTNGFVIPQGPLQSSTVAPESSTRTLNTYNVLPQRVDVQNLQDEWLRNRQLTIDPSQISQQNIISQEQVQSSTLGPGSATPTNTPYNILPQTVDIQNLQQEWLRNRQLSIDPSQISQHNIIPPEIGLPKGAIDLGSTVQTKITQTPSPDINGVPRAPGLLFSPNIQRNDKANLQRIDTSPAQRTEANEISLEAGRTFQNGYYQNEILVGNTGRNIYPQPSFLNNINGEHSGAPPNSSPTQFGDVPLSDGLQIQSEDNRQQEYDDRVVSSLWNRYGRKRRNRKP